MIDAEYCRISKDKAGTANGVESQHIENAEFAEELGIALAASYVDNDVSAFSGVERPEYRRMLADMRAGKISSVTVWHANRLHRSSDEVNEFIRVARKHRVKLYSTSKGEAYNLEKASGRKQLRDDTSEAEYESEHRGERVMMARKRQARRGEYGGGPRPYGWGVPTNRVRSRCINPKAPAMERIYEDRPVLDMSRHNVAEAAQIRRWADDLLAGITLNSIVHDLNARGIPTVAQSDGQRIKKVHGRQVEHKGWKGATIRQILSNPRTAGHAVYRGEIINRNAYEPIIPDDVQQALITLFADPTRRSSSGSAPRWLGSLIYRCGVCDDGAVLRVSGATRSGPTYRCIARSHCTWPAERLDEAVTKLLIARLSREDVADLIPTGRPQVDVTAKRRELKLMEEQKIDAAQRYARRKIDGDQLEQINALIDHDMAQIRAELSAVTARSPIEEFATSTRPAREVWENLTIARKREILRSTLSITLEPIGRGRNFTRDKIKVGRPTRPTPVAA